MLGLMINMTKLVRTLVVVCLVAVALAAAFLNEPSAALGGAIDIADSRDARVVMSV